MSGHQFYTNNLPFYRCDNCQLASVSQSPTNLNLLTPTCEHQDSRTFNEETNRVACERWMLRKILSDEEEVSE